MKKWGVAAFLAVLWASSLPASARDREDRTLVEFEKRLRLGVEHDGLYMEEPGIYSSDFAMLRVAHPDVFDRTFTACDWQRINGLYRDALKKNRWEVALGHAYHLAIIAPGRVSELNLHDSDWQAMKGGFLRYYREYPEYTLGVAARLKLVFPERMGELSQELSELRLAVRDGLGWDIRCFKNSCFFKDSTPEERRHGYRAYWRSFLPAYANFKAVYGEDVGPRLDDADWQRMSKWGGIRARAQVKMARYGLANVLAQIPVSDFVRADGDDCTPKAVAGLRPEGSWSIGTNFSGPSSGGWYIGYKIMFFRLSKNWRAGGIGGGLAKFSSTAEWTGADGDTHGNRCGGLMFTIIPLKWKDVALEITPYKRQVLGWHPEGGPTKGVVFALTLGFGTTSAYY